MHNGGWKQFGFFLPVCSQGLPAEDTALAGTIMFIPTTITTTIAMTPKIANAVLLFS
ncbi:MAG TPA: hypothetical protein VFI73_04875 [Candidatus Nitrosopolaris sp.]|nr:hypothetical protein [Candidatus Nitrosopolaris sp.]